VCCLATGSCLPLRNAISPSSRTLLIFSLPVASFLLPALSAKLVLSLLWLLQPDALAQTHVFCRSLLSWPPLLRFFPESLPIWEGKGPSGKQRPPPVWRDGFMVVSTGDHSDAPSMWMLLEVH
jgi:hypothetical protein